MKIEKWVITPHAAERMEERDIHMRELREVIENPSEVIKQGPKYILAKNIKGRDDNTIATVVIEKKEHGLWLVITVMVNFQVK